MNYQEIGDNRPARRAFRPMHRSPATSIPPQIQPPGEVCASSECCSDLLRDHAREPRNVGWLERANGRAILQDQANGAAVGITIFVVDRTVGDIAFRAFGPPRVIACASFMTECVRGQSLKCVHELDEELVGGALGLPDEEYWCVELVIDCLRCAVRDYREHIRPHHDPLPPSRHRHRRSTTHAESVARRNDRRYKMGLLCNLLLAFELGQSARSLYPDTHSKVREDILCDMIDVKRILGTLPQDLKQVVILMGILGMTLRESAKRLGITHMGVQKRLERAAILLCTPDSDAFP